MVASSSRAADDEFRDIKDTFRSLEERIKKYMDAYNQILADRKFDHERLKKELSRRLNTTDDMIINKAIHEERLAATHRRAGDNPFVGIPAFCTRIARFYATASPLHRQEIFKLFQSHKLLVAHFSKFIAFIEEQISSSAERAEEWLGIGLIICGLEAGQTEERDTHYWVDLIIEKAKSMGVNPGPVIDEIVSIIPREGIPYLDSSYRD